ncbi:MAG: chitobiase/beta-hexosaminidase C-terminal domain-containing protein [Prevotella sp.]|jgi:hypothetical protein
MTTSLRLLVTMLLYLTAGSISAQTITDVLNFETIGISDSKYMSWEYTLSSGATYEGNTKGENKTIQLRSSYDSGIVVTKTGGIVKSIKIKLYKTNVANRQVDVYGSNTQYTGLSDLYNAGKGELIGSVTPKMNEVVISPNTDYAYIGIRSKSGLINVDQIEIEWENKEAPSTISAPTIQGTSPFNNSTTISIASDEGAHIYYTINGEAPSTASTKYMEPFIISQTTTVKAIAVKDELTSAVSVSTFEKLAEEDTNTYPDVAEKGSLRNPYTVTEVINGQSDGKKNVYVVGYICGAYYNNYGKIEINNEVDANIIIGTTADATDYIAIELPKGNLRNAINVSDGGMIGTRVILKGNIVANYFGGRGLKATSEAHIGVQVTNAKYATLYFSKTTLQIPNNLTAFTYKLDGGKLVESRCFTTGENVAAGTAVVLNGEPGNYWCKVITEDGRSVKDTNNLLRGTDTSTYITADTNSYFYMLSLNAINDPNSVGFYWGAEQGATFTNGAHKAYLQIEKNTADTNAKRFYLFSNNPTSIQPAIQSVSHDNASLYNIAGQKVNSHYKGIIIRNGKKYISK